jgi:hypothetical protein
MKRDQLPTQRVLVISDSSDAPAQLGLINTKAALSHARLSHDVLDLSADETCPDFGQYSAVLTVTENLPRLTSEQVSDLSDFVEAGGGMAALYRAQPSALDQLFGIVAQSGPAPSGTVQGGGLRFPGLAMPAFAGIVLAPEIMIGHTGLDQLPDVRARSLATSFCGKPVAWTMPVGKGRTAYWNSVFLCEKRARGLIIQTLEAIQPVTAVPCVNAGVLQIDDFPAPLVGQLPDVVQQGLPGLSPEAFYKDVWYPDMQRLASQFGAKLSCFCAFDYTEAHEWKATGLSPDSYRPPPETFEPLHRNSPAELGLHGYNHQPLRLSDWPDKATMKSKLQRARAFWDAYGCGPPPTAYVPPNNQYDQAGLELLAEVFPSIKVISGSFFGRHSDGGNREFGPEPWSPDLFCLPRVSSGHECLPQTLFDSASQLATLGLWTHFMHPDDALDIPSAGTSSLGRRNPNRRPWRTHKGRQGLYEQAQKLFAFVAGRFPWLRYRTTTEAASRVQDHLRSDWTIAFQGDTVRIAGPAGGYLRLRLNHRPWRRISDCTGCNCVHETVTRDHSTYLLQLQAEAAQVNLSDTTWIQAAAGRVRDSVSRLRAAS